MIDTLAGKTEFAEEMIRKADFLATEGILNLWKGADQFSKRSPEDDPEYDEEKIESRRATHIGNRTDDKALAQDMGFETKIRDVVAHDDGDVIKLGDLDKEIDVKDSKPINLGDAANLFKKKSTFNDIDLDEKKDTVKTKKLSPKNMMKSENKSEMKNITVPQIQTPAFKGKHIVTKPIEIKPAKKEVPRALTPPKPTSENQKIPTPSPETQFQAPDPFIFAESNFPAIPKESTPHPDTHSSIWANFSSEPKALDFAMKSSPFADVEPPKSKNAKNSKKQGSGVKLGTKPSFKKKKENSVVFGGGDSADADAKNPGNDSKGADKARKNRKDESRQDALPKRILEEIEDEDRVEIAQKGAEIQKKEGIAIDTVRDLKKTVVVPVKDEVIKKAENQKKEIADKKEIIEQNNDIIDKQEKKLEVDAEIDSHQENHRDENLFKDPFAESISNLGQSKHDIFDMDHFADQSQSESNMTNPLIHNSETELKELANISNSQIKSALIITGDMGNFSPIENEFNFLDFKSINFDEDLDRPLQQSTPKEIDISKHSDFDSNRQAEVMFKIESNPHDGSSQEVVVHEDEGMATPINHSPKQDTPTKPIGKEIEISKEANPFANQIFTPPVVDEEVEEIVQKNPFMLASIDDPEEEAYQKSELDQDNDDDTHMKAIDELKEKELEQKKLVSEEASKKIISEAPKNQILIKSTQEPKKEVKLIGIGEVLEDLANLGGGAHDIIGDEKTQKDKELNEEQSLDQFMLESLNESNLRPTMDDEPDGTNNLFNFDFA